MYCVVYCLCLLFIIEMNGEMLIPKVDLNKCLGQTICAEVTNYPQEYIERLLLQDPSFYVSMLADDQNLDKTNFRDITRRKRQIRNESEVTITTVCESQRRRISPSVGRTENDEWRFIVNVPGQNQFFEVDVCVNPNSECITDKNTTSECRQNYNFKSMLALNDKGEPVTELFKIPSDCSCYYSK